MDARGHGEKSTQRHTDMEEDHCQGDNDDKEGGDGLSSVDNIKNCRGGENDDLNSINGENGEINADYDFGDKLMTTDGGRGHEVRKPVGVMEYIE